MEPWRAKLAEGDSEAAWDLFIDRYRRLIFAVIRRTIEGRDEVLDAFVHVCQALSAHDLARLERYTEGDFRGARFSTWLVTVVRNLTIDWIRHRRGRPRREVPAGLSPLQREIFRHVFGDRRPHAEAYELVRASASGELSFGEFLEELAETYRVVEAARGKGAMHYFRSRQPPREPPESPRDPVAAAEVGARLADALETLPADRRLAVKLYVVDGLSAAEVARTLGWPNAKAVYNRVYRALATLRAALEREGVRSADG